MDAEHAEALILAAEHEIERVERTIAGGQLDLTVERDLKDHADVLRTAVVQLRAEAPVEVPHEHVWQLTEDGYTRTWDTEIKDDGTIVARYTGAEDWTEEGDGVVYLACAWCVARRELTEAEVQGITYR